MPVPANPEALIAAEASGIDTKLLKGWARRVLETPSSEDPVVLEVEGFDSFGYDLAAAIREAADQGIDRALRRHRAGSDRVVLELSDWHGPETRCRPWKSAESERFDVDHKAVVNAVRTAVRREVVGLVEREVARSRAAMMGRVDYSYRGTWYPTFTKE